jgi:cell division protein FtsB
MQPKTKRKGNIFFRIVLLLLVIVALYFLIKPLAVIDYKIARLLDENDRLNAQKLRLEADLDSLEQDMEKGKTLAGYELKARENLQMIYEGEKLYICKDSQGQDLKSGNEISRIQSSAKPEKSIFEKVWDMILGIFRI